MHELPKESGRVKNAPDDDSARCEIRVCAHAVMKCTDYPTKSVGLGMHRTMIVQGARVGSARSHIHTCLRNQRIVIKCGRLVRHVSRRCERQRYVFQTNVRRYCLRHSTPIASALGFFAKAWLHLSYLRHPAPVPAHTVCESLPLTGIIHTRNFGDVPQQRGRGRPKGKAEAVAKRRHD